MSSTIHGIFLYGAAPQNGAAVKLWQKSAFSDPGPAYDVAEPSSGLQVGSTVTTGTTHGGAGAYRFTGIAEGDYWLSVEYAGHRSWEAISVSPPAQIRALTSASSPTGLTTSGTTELTVVSSSFTPAVSGQCLVVAHLSLLNPTVANDVFKTRLYVAGTSRAETTTEFAATSPTPRKTVSLAAIGPVVAGVAAEQKITVTRDSGTGAITAEGLRCTLSWLYLPGVAAS